MTPAVMECENDVCKVDVDYDSWVANELEARIERFVDAVEADEDLELLGTTEDYKKFVVRNKRIDETLDEAYPTILVSEVLRLCIMHSGSKKAFHANMTDKIIKVLKGEETNITQIAYSRPVGYFSRIINWNASILGQLKDRASGRKHGSFTVTHENHLYEDEAIEVVNRYNPKV